MTHLVYTSVIEVATGRKRELVDITAAARRAVKESGVQEGICALYAHGATAALMIQENDDPESRSTSSIAWLAWCPKADGATTAWMTTGAAHILAGLVGPSETIPVRDGELALSTWQNVFLCDFDGPGPAAGSWSRSPAAPPRLANP